MASLPDDYLGYIFPRGLLYYCSSASEERKESRVGGRISKVNKISLSGKTAVKATVFGIRQTWIQILLCHLLAM